jgi:hypothetical protein
MSLYLFLVPFLSEFSNGRTARNLLDALYLGIYELGHILLILFVVWVADGNLHSLGIRRVKWPTDLWLGILVGAVLLIVGLPFLHSSLLHLAQTKPPALHQDRSVIFAFQVVNVMASIRQAIFVAYLFSRIRELLRNDYIAIALAASMFAVIYLPVGAFDALMTFLWGLVFAVVLWKIGRIWPLLLMPVGTLLVSFLTAIVDGVIRR